MDKYVRKEENKTPSCVWNYLLCSYWNKESTYCVYKTVKKGS